MAKLLASAVALGTAFISAAAWFDARRKTQKPTVECHPTEFNNRVLAACPSLNLPYQPVMFMTNPHVETIFAAKTRTKPAVRYQREILHTSDGGCVALDWQWEPESDKALPADAPVLVLLPGLTGGSGDSYVSHAVVAARAAGMRAVVFNSRGTADSPVITPQFYSASFTGDTRAVVAHVARRYPASRALLAAGWSLGANILLRYLGEEGAATPLRAAVSMCNPFNLTISNQGLKSGFSRIYDLNLATSLRNIFMKHELLWTGMPPPFRPDDVAAGRCPTIRDFDDAITIHSFGWPSVDAYYAGSSSALSVPHLPVPTLCIQALDDPIAPKEATPFEALRAQPLATTVTTLTGGHLGWVEARTGATGAPWTNAVMFEWLSAVVEELGRSGSGGKGGKQQEERQQDDVARQLVSEEEEVAGVVARVGA
ncbi:hypothetical protein HYH02_012927 [Chlamydomonas schloesseri]|uniref:AB hydrolase-1 domain-containing protein n=1 Tax=Chlamydomonas schloesseri TaxID=2026947 RepID=A0A835SSJ0_9CHLO|nr:hypothetical protein HYH02_012927 [Chlamydomonas schloesseri]|eukprot:KAG2432353.1 hypothetical protein HYH02_012927 [Chlamydomonas schloesseri]